MAVVAAAGYYCMSFILKKTYNIQLQIMLQLSLVNCVLCIEPFLQCVSFSTSHTSSWILNTARTVWNGLKATQTVTPIVISD